MNHTTLRSWLTLVLLVLLSLVMPATARAQQASGQVSESEQRAAQLQQLERELDGHAQTLNGANNNCDVACEALEAMQRAVARICALAEAARCTAARDKAEAARRKLLKACPSCAVAQPARHQANTSAPKRNGASVPLQPNSQPKPPNSQPRPLKVKPQPSASVDTDPTSAPNQPVQQTHKGARNKDRNESDTLNAAPGVASVERTRGGCAACNVGNQAKTPAYGHLAELLFLLGAAAAFARRQHR